MLSFIKQCFLYVYILFTKSKQRNETIKHLKRKCRSQRDVAFDKPGLPDAVDDIYGTPDGWSEFHSFVGFDRDGTCIHVNVTNQESEGRELCVNLPTIGTLWYSEKDNDFSEPIGKKRIVIETVDPMTKWKISFRGHMKSISQNDVKPKTCFVRFHFYWKSAGDPYDFWLDSPPMKLARECSKLPLSEALLLLSSKSLWFEQWGELRGSLLIDDTEYTIRMPACRERKYVCRKAFENRIQSVMSQVVEVDGIAHRYANKTIEYRNGYQLKFGHVIFPSLEYFSTELESTEAVASTGAFNIRFCNIAVEAVERLGKTVLQETNRKMRYNKYEFDGKKASGVTLVAKVNSLAALEQQKNTIKEVDIKDETIFLIDITDVQCSNKTLVGGKAANLNSLVKYGFNVPIAFCITANLFHKVLHDNPDLIESVKGIESCINELRLEKLKDVCERVVQCFAKCTINVNIVSQIEAKINSMIAINEETVAVRSSARGEDGELLSAAGQLETILGVKGIVQVMEAIKQCWSSYFSFQSVEYRRQNGQAILDGMGVIIQKMIPSDVSGVMMTSNPVSGREDRILINASYGLGEAVVSGTTEPDTFLIGLDDGDAGRFTILKETIGEKTKRVDLTISGGTCVQEVAASLETCLSKDVIYQLCTVGKSIESKFRLDQEIEWAVCDGSLYILQTRPITAIEEETEAELFHEFDTPALGDRELITTCNSQEMMPGATTPLTASYFIGMVTDAFAYTYTHICSGAKRIYHPVGFAVACGNSFFLNMAPLYVYGANNVGGLKTKTSIDIDILGEECKDVTTDDIMNYKGTPLNTNWQLMKCIAWKLFFEAPKLEKDFSNWEMKMYEYSIGEDCKDANILYQLINADRFNFYHACRIYFYLMDNIFAAIMKSIIKGDSEDFSKENKEDLSNLLIKVGTVSAEVPQAIAKLAKAIKTSGLSDTFVQLGDKESLKLLQDTNELRCLLADFMKYHGHRGIREAELFEKSWSQNPSKLIKSLKSILVNGAAERKDDRIDESKLGDIIDNMNTKVTSFQRWLIRRHLLKRTLKKIQERERGKSLIIKVAETFKKAYWSLAELMVREGRIPEENLLFFLTHREIGELLDTRSPKLIKKAKRRMKIFPRQHAAQYEQFSFGSPKLIEDDSSCLVPLRSSAVLEGMPVGSGEAIGRACIIFQEEDVCNIKKGDILVCRYTDVGWSPYFPLISGLVTEIGSILSHGAVVARECGIPCIVSVKHATRLLKSGDMLRIHGTKGTVEKLNG